ncbi:MAG: alpha-E domain-containing protein [Pseudomonadota bacterium]|nr:alpha-E domain-containing protein [Pseudomonadota bacterium]
MILTLSAASSLYWLGRYMVRVEGLCRLEPFQDDAHAVAYANAFSLPAWNVETLSQLLRDPNHLGSLPNNLAVIQDNVQSVRGILGREVFEAFNALWRQRGQSDACICDLLHQASQHMQALDLFTQVFWSLGRAVESVDMALRLGEPAQPAAQQVLQVAQRLPDPEWQSILECAEQLAISPDTSNLYGLCDRLHPAFVEGPR